MLPGGHTFHVIIHINLNHRRLDYRAFPELTKPIEEISKEEFKRISVNMVDTETLFYDDVKYLIVGSCMIPYYIYYI